MDLSPQWEYFADTVMGGVSTGQVAQAQTEGRAATRLTGDVSLENNGGFIQMAFDLVQGGGTLDASAYTGVEIEVFGNGAGYEVRLRTDQLTRPWHSYRTEITAPAQWHTIRLPWESFEGRKTDVPFDPARLRRIGVLAIGSEMQADISVSHVRFYR